MVRLVSTRAMLDCMMEKWVNIQGLLVSKMDWQGCILQDSVVSWLEMLACNWGTQDCSLGRVVLQDWGYTDSVLDCCWESLAEETMQDCSQD